MGPFWPTFGPFLTQLLVLRSQIIHFYRFLIFNDTPKMMKKPWISWISGFSRFCHFCRNWRNRFRIVKMSIEITNFETGPRGRGKGVPLLLALFGGSRNGSKNGSFLDPTFGKSIKGKWWNDHFFGVQKMTKKWVIFWTPQKVRISSFSGSSTKNDPNMPFFHLFSVFGQKRVFFTVFVIFWDT